MKNRNFTILCGLFCAAVCAHAQVPQIGKAAAKAAQRATSAVTVSAAKGVTHEVLYNYGGAGRAAVAAMKTFDTGTVIPVGSGRVVIPPVVRSYMDEFPQLHPESVQLDLERFPVHGPVDARIFKESLENSVARVAAIEQQKVAFYSGLHSEVFEDIVPYHRYLPAEAVDYVYVGEVHHHRQVGQEVVRLVNTLKKRYAPRKIYFATEYIWDTRATHATLEEDLPLAMAENQQQLREMMRMDYDKHPFLKDFVDNGITVVGLEPRTAMWNKTYEEAAVAQQSTGIQNRFYRLNLSEAGMKMRNERWVQHLRQLRAQDPDALIVVHGGADHMRYDKLYSIPSLLGGRGFSFLLLDVIGVRGINPILATLKDQDFLWRQVYQTPTGKYVLSFKRPDLQRGRTSAQINTFKQSLGADVVVMLQDGRPMIMP